VTVSSTSFLVKLKPISLILIRSSANKVSVVSLRAVPHPTADWCLLIARSWRVERATPYFSADYLIDVTSPSSKTLIASCIWASLAILSDLLRIIFFSLKLSFRLEIIKKIKNFFFYFYLLSNYEYKYKKKFQFLVTVFLVFFLSKCWIIEARKKNYDKYCNINSKKNFFEFFYSLKHNLYKNQKILLICISIKI